MTTKRWPSLKHAKARLRIYGVSLRCSEGEYRVNTFGSGEATAYYTTDLDDALETGRMMALEAIRRPVSVDTFMRMHDHGV